MALASSPGTARSTDLRQIVEAVQAAARGALTFAKTRQREMLSRYLVADGLPFTFKLKVPNPELGTTGGAWQELELPVHAFLQLSQIQMRELRVRLDAHAEVPKDLDESWRAGPDLGVYLGSDWPPEAQAVTIELIIHPTPGEMEAEVFDVTVKARAETVN